MSSVPIGQCYSWAYREALNRGATLVHANVRDPWDGHAYSHAWVEVGNKVYDWQGSILREGKPISRAKFYKLYRPTDVSKYESDEIPLNLAREKHYGPWISMEALSE